jgi:serine/threonine protein kinase
MTQQEFRKRYEFDIKTDNIGGGSFGTVYKAYDTVLDIEVAIKVSEVKIVGDKEFSLLEEYKAIENLKKHKNIANYEQVYRFESFPAIYDYGIMQYYALGNLSHYLKNNEVSLEKRDSITKDILEGIAFLHQHKVVHRDLKPSNVLVVDRRGKIIPKITDFGLSKQAEGDGKASRFTNSFAGGTLQYSSPEQLKGLPLKLNTDLWSFGAIAYEILTGKTLFEADNQGTASAEWQNTITQKILHADINEELQNLPSNWQKLVRLCLERDVNKRVQDSEILFRILKGDESLTSSNEVENKSVQKSVASNNEATIIKGNKQLKKDVEKSKEISQNISSNKNDATIIKGNKRQEKVVEKPKSYTHQKVTKLKKEDPKWMLPSIAAAVIILLGTIGYFMFSSDDVKPVETKLSVFKVGDFYGYKKGNTIEIPAKYTDAEIFVKDSAKVSTKDSSFYISKKGAWLGTISNSEAYKKELADQEKNAILIADENAWVKAKKSNSKVSYQKYLNAFKKGKYKKSATSALAILINKEKEEIKKNNSNSKIIENAKIRNSQSEKSFNILEQAENYYYGQRGVEKEVEKGIKLFIESANLGNLEAQYMVGYIYDNGDYVPKNEREAVKWYLKSANQGYFEAYLALGSSYELGKGVKKDFKEAMKYYVKASKKNSSNGDYNIGRMYEYGLGVQINIVEAKKWYQRAIKKNHFDAKNALKRLEN